MWLPPAAHPSLDSHQAASAMRARADTSRATRAECRDIARSGRPYKAPRPLRGLARFHEAPASSVFKPEFFKQILRHGEPVSSRPSMVAHRLQRPLQLRFGIFYVAFIPESTFDHMLG